MSKKLKPCPFCGGEAKLGQWHPTDYFGIQCTKCGATTADWPSEKIAISEWNRRNYHETQA